MQWKFFISTRYHNTSWFLESCILKQNSFIDGFSHFWGKYDDKEKCKYAVRENFPNAKGVSWNGKNYSCFAKHEAKQLSGIKWNDWWSCLFEGRVRLKFLFPELFIFHFCFFGKRKIFHDYVSLILTTGKTCTTDSICHVDFDGDWDCCLDGRCRRGSKNCRMSKSIYFH